MDFEFSKYTLSQTLHHHTAIVRSISCQGNLILTASSDKTAKLYVLEQGQYTLLTNVDFFDNYIYSTTTRPNGGFAIGCGNTIYLLDSQGNPDGALNGHDAQVCSLNSIDEHTLISGSWDATAIVWNNGVQQYRLKGHKHGVAVLGLDAQNYLTGSQDGVLRKWFGQNQVKEIKAHTDIIREIVVISDIGFLTCSNDETLKIWSMDLELIQELLGHTGYVFSCKYKSNILSGSDDRTAKIWGLGGQMFQNIQFPGTVWTVAYNNEDDIIVGCDDGRVRIFTYHHERNATQEQIDQFEQEAQLSEAQKTVQLSPDQLKNLPSTSQMSQMVGKKNGEIRLFKNGDKPEAYMWNGTEWTLMGDVLGSGQQQKRIFDGDKYFPAGEYDYIFDVEDDNGLQKRLPFNDGESHMAAAEKFCLREGYSKHYMQQIVNFLKQNTRNVQQQQQQYAQPQQKKQEYDYLPYTQYFLYENKNVEGLKKKLLEFNQQVTEYQLTEKDIIYFMKGVDQLLDPAQPKLDNTVSQVFMNKLFKWPNQFLLPVWDFLRIFNLHHSSETLYSGLDKGITIILDANRLIDLENQSPVFIRLILQTLTNCFYHNANQYSMLKYLSIFGDIIKTQAIQKCDEKTNIVVANLIMNYSIAIFQKPLFNEEAGLQLSQAIQNFLHLQRDQESLIKVVTAVGNLMLSKDIIRNQSLPILKPIILGLNIQTDNQDTLKCLQEVKRSVI
ncbi:hypothetical protein pb186bvf_008430 [Paramecium bursaria]